MTSTGMKIGYARVSTADQNLDLQEDALRAAKCEKIFTDMSSGSKTDRKGLTQALAYVRAGDTLVVWRLDRLGRSLKQLIDLVQDLHTKGIHFTSLEESIDTSTPTGQFFFHVTGAFAELERNLIRERKSYQIDLVIETSSQEGMITLNRSLASLIDRRIVSLEQALIYSQNPAELKVLVERSA